MNPNDIVIIDYLDSITGTGSRIEIPQEIMREAMDSVMKGLAESRPMPDIASDIPAYAIASLTRMGRRILGAEIDTSDEKSSGPISEINIANIL